MKTRGGTPEVNTGSMADIAFLLLIFFLVTTTIETDVGLDRMLPREDVRPPLPYQDKNILQVRINKNDEIMVENEVVDLKDLKALTMNFLDNGGALKDSESYCDYCQGARREDSSDNPGKAVVSLSSERETRYATYISIQNELVAAYNELRNREAIRLYGVKYTEMEAKYTDPQTHKFDKVKLKNKLLKIQELYPQKISEAEIR